MLRPSRRSFTTAKACLAHSRRTVAYAAGHASRRSQLDSVMFATGIPSSPGSSQPTPPPPDPQTNAEEEYVSDKEWELRVGRAMDILQQNLPCFFTTGLVATTYRLPIHMHGLLGGKGKGHAADLEDECDSTAGIYSRTIRLEYTPPIALPAPFPRKLHVDGLPLYVASSVFVRHTLNALYTDLTVTTHKVNVRNGGLSPPQNESSFPGHSPLKPNGDNRVYRREKAITIGILVSGMSRLGLSAGRTEWDVTATYSFSRRTGLIDLHTVNSIDPAPSETVYTALQSALSAFGGGLATPGGDRKPAVNAARADSRHQL